MALGIPQAALGSGGGVDGGGVVVLLVVWWLMSGVEAPYPHQAKASPRTLNVRPGTPGLGA